MHSQGNSESDQESVIEFHSLTDSIAPMSQTVPTPTLQPELLPQVAVLVANMIESYLDTYHPFGPRMEVKDDQRADIHPPDRQLQDHGPAPGEEGVCLYSSIDTGASVTSSGEYEPSICVARESVDLRLEREWDSSIGSGPRPVWIPQPQPAGLQDAARRRISRGS